MQQSPQEALVPTVWKSIRRGRDQECAALEVPENCLP
jgi:hypothetical protein